MLGQAKGIQGRRAGAAYKSWPSTGEHTQRTVTSSGNFPESTGGAGRTWAGREMGWGRWTDPGGVESEKELGLYPEFIMCEFHEL